jgi:GntR family transcriptional regulator
VIRGARPGNGTGARLGGVVSENVAPRRLPRHAQIAEVLRAQIRDGALAAGAPLPSEAKLIEQFGVSRGTVRHALAALRAEGLILVSRGRVPVVRRGGLVQSFDTLVSFSRWAQQLGRVPSAQTIELARRSSDPETAAQLAIEPGTPVFTYTRLRLMDGAPVLVERTNFLESAGRLLLDFDLDHGSVYEQLADGGIELVEAQQRISAIAASAEDAALLQIPRRSPVLAVRRRASTVDGTVVEWSHDHYRGDMFEITIHNEDVLARSGFALRSDEEPG